MKIVKAVRDLYLEHLPTFEKLSTDVGRTLEAAAASRGWFYFSRIKSLESFALKLETGRVQEPSKLEDFFACTIVVPTMEEVRNAIEAVLARYCLVYRRPKDDILTTKRPSSFEFDDLRLYVRRPRSETGYAEELTGLVFEVQVKTALQYGWSQATHDLTYKGDSVNWALERVAFQIKAMLEHAEVAISEAKELAHSDTLAKQDRRTKELSLLLEETRDIWPQVALPTDVKRLAENMLSVLQLCGLAAKDLPRVIQVERDRVGILPMDLSPYAFLVQALAWNEEMHLHEQLNREHRRIRIVVHGGMELPDWLWVEHPRVVNLGEPKRV